MRRILPLFTTLARELGLISMVCTYPAANIKAEVPVEAFGVWDRGLPSTPKSIHS